MFVYELYSAGFVRMDMDPCGLSRMNEVATIFPHWVVKLVMYRVKHKKCILLIFAITLSNRIIL